MSRTLRNILFYGIGDFVVTGVTAFLFIPLYIKYLTVSDYGIFNILNNNTTIFTYVFQFGIISAFSRIYFIKKEQGKDKEYIWSIIHFHLLFSLCLVVIIFFLRHPIFNALSPSVENQKLLLYPVATAFITFLPALYYILLRVQEKAKNFVYYQLLNVTLITTLVLITLFFFKISLYSILLCFIITNLSIWLIVLYKFCSNFFLKVDIYDVIETLKFAFPIFISYIAYFFISKYSIIILQKHVSLKEIGMFSLAQQIATIPTLITIAIAKSVQPYLFSSSSSEELKSRAQTFDYNFKLIMIWVVGSLIFSVDIVFNNFLPVSYHPIHDITKYLLLIMLIYNFSIVENSILLYFMKSKTILGITVVGSLLNILLSNLLIVDFSINGVLISMAIAFLINFSLDVYFSNKHIKLTYKVKTIIPCILIIISYLVISSGNLFSIYKLYSIQLSIIYFLVISVIIGLLLKKAKT